MPVGESWAIATQQSHALGKSPKGYGTEKGRAVAKSKYKTPEDDKKIAAALLAEVQYDAFVDELGKIAGAFDSMVGGTGKAIKGIASAAERSAPAAGKVTRSSNFIPAVVGSPARKAPLPKGPLNPGGGFH